MSANAGGGETQFQKLSRTAVGRVTSRFTRLLGGSARLRYAASFLRSQLWAWPILTSLGLALAGWLVDNAVNRAVTRNREGYLVTVRDSVVAALKIWVADATALVKIAAEDDGLLGPVRQLVAPPGGKVDSAAIAAAHATLKDQLRRPIADAKLAGFFVVDKSGFVVAADQVAPIGTELKDDRREFFDRILAGESAVSRPFASPLMLVDKRGRQRANLPTMFAAAPIRDNGNVIAALGLRLHPEEQFSRMLATAQFGETGETYAFDRSGTLVSESRFVANLVDVGLLPDRDDATAVLELRVCDPEVDMTLGARPKLKRSEQPLTKMAQSAIAGETAVDPHGYRDYRGVVVAGAWTWLPELDVGIATEVDLAEVVGPLRVLKIAFAALIGLLLLAAGAIYAAMWYMSHQHTALQAAAVEAKRLGQYTLEEKLGEGGMGAVYKARHAMLCRPTAIKLLHPSNVDAKSTTRFEREVQSTANLTHPNTISIYDYGRTADGVFYYAMEYLEGINLDDLVANHGTLPESRTIWILKQVCGSLAEAHAAGIIHRDIKPANVVLTSRGGVYDFVKVLDFGLAKGVGNNEATNLTTAGMVVGTPLYLSPEAIESPEQLDARSDVYAVGAVAYFLLTGMPVFTGASAIDVCMKHVRETPEPPSARRGSQIESSLEALVLRCLAKKREDRPASAAELQVLLESCPGSHAWTATDARAWWTNYSKLAANGTKSIRPRISDFVSVEASLDKTGAFEG